MHGMPLLMDKETHSLPTNQLPHQEWYKLPTSGENQSTTPGEIQSTLNMTHTPMNMASGMMTKPVNKLLDIQMTGMIHTLTNMLNKLQHNKLMAASKVVKPHKEEEEWCQMTHTPHIAMNTEVKDLNMEPEILILRTEEPITTGDGEI